MSLSASLIASIVSAILETVTQGSTVNAHQYEIYATTRTLPPEAKTGVMQPPQNDGTITIDGKSLPLTPGAQFRNPQNLVVMPMTIQDNRDVVYLTNDSGAVHRVWMITSAERSALPKN